MRGKRLGTTVATTLGVLLGGVGVVLAVSGLVNGSFESNGGVGTTTFTGWTEVEFGPGAWFVQSGTTPPLGGPSVPAPPDGLFAAMTNEGDPSAMVLYQDFTVPPSATLRCDIFIRNDASDFVVPSPDTLDPTGDPNQHARIDIMQTSAGPFDLGSAVLQNLFITNPGDNGNYSAYQTITASLSGFAGQTVRLRFAVADNESELIMGVDNCALVTPGPSAPAMRMPGLAALVVGLLILAYSRLRRGAA